MVHAITFLLPILFSATLFANDTSVEQKAPSVTDT